MNTDAIEVTLQVTQILEELGIDYVIGGSIASSLYGYSRNTYDSDIVADIRPEHVSDLLDRFQPDFYISDIALHEAIRRRSSFNLIHLSTSFKVDIFVPKSRAFDHDQFDRGMRYSIDDSERSAKFSTAEDVILAKLEWYRLGEETSSRQWHDILGILAVQANQIDRDYLSETATQLGVTDLLLRAFEEAEK